MSKSKAGKKLKQIKSALVVMSRIDYEIARNVYDLLDAAHINDEELSFLLGKPNPYFFDLINPTGKDKFKTAQLDVLPTILNTTIRKIIPNNILPKETVKLINTFKTVYENKVVYSYTVKYDNGRLSEPQKLEKNLIKGYRRQKNTLLHDALLCLVADGYFSEPKRALQIYLTLLEEVDISFTPADLQKSLAVLCRKDGPESVLMVQIMEGCYYYNVSGR